MEHVHSVKIGEGDQMGRCNFLMIPKWILLSIQYIRTGENEFLNLVTVLILHIDPQNLTIPIIGLSSKSLLKGPLFFATFPKLG